MIAVTGASGGIGGRVARSLAAEGCPLRLVVRDAARAPALDAPDWAIEGWVTSYAAQPAGMREPPSDTVRRILARSPRALADVRREPPESMAHLRR